MGKIRDELFIKHRIDSTKDPRVLQLIGKYGGDGFMVYWLLLEYLWGSTQYIAPDNIPIISLTHLATPADKADKIIKYCLEIHLLEKEKKIKKYKGQICSPMLLADKAAMEAKSQKCAESGRIGAKTRAAKASERLANANQNSSERLANKKKTQTQEEDVDVDVDADVDVEEDLTDNNGGSGSSNDDTSSKGALFDFPQDTIELCDEVCDKFNNTYPRVYYQKVEDLIQELLKQYKRLNYDRTRIISYIQKGLDKLDTAEAIKQGKITFTINSFLKPDTFLKLIDGAYDKVSNSSKSAYTGANITFGDDNPMYRRD